jgi:AmmeMemoRadiSam system protein A
LAEALKKREDRIRFTPNAHAQEHSLEIQLPFLQTVMPQFKLVPLVMGEQDYSTCQWLAEALADAIRGKSVLVVASSDLSHFHSYDAAKSLDQIVLNNVQAFNPEGLDKSLAQGECEACGGGAVITAMLTARLLGANESEVLFYANSGDVTGDRSRVVGYMAAAFWKNDGKPADALENDSRKTGVDLGLSADEKAFLHKIAQEAIAAEYSGEKAKNHPVVSTTLKERRGAFVTLRKNGRLRGCIGHIQARLPLAETIKKMARAAAFEDPRFPPLDAEELDEVNIEISVLTPLRRVADVKEIEIGKDGIYINKDYHAGILLPQVASEQGWDRDAFLEHTCMKAGLPKDAWKNPDTEIYLFSADIF